MKRGDFEPRGPKRAEAGQERRPTEASGSTSPSVYALTKYVQERLVMMLPSTYGIEAAALRLFNACGPGQTLTIPYTAVWRFSPDDCSQASRRWCSRMACSGDIVHVRDVARAFRLAMEATDAAGEVVNIGSGVSRTVLDVVERWRRSSAATTSSRKCCSARGRAISVTASPISARPTCAGVRAAASSGKRAR